MTRFQIVGIFEDKILTAGEFNGDGYFDGMGKEVCREFAKITTEKEYRKLAKDTNANGYGYEGQIVHTLEPTVQVSANEPEIDIFDFSKQKENSEYYHIWFSDYLYIKNFTDEDKEIIDEEGVLITIHSQGWVTLYFGNLYIEEDDSIAENCQNNVKIDYTFHIKQVCEKYDWDVEVEGDGLYISQYTPAGEDFGFYVDLKNSVQDIKNYAEDFDVDEHVKMWILESNSGAPGIRALLEDAEWIDDKLQELSRAFN